MPAELPVVSGKPVVHGAKASGEALRRQAREPIDSIPAFDLASALTYIEFLKQRGPDAMSGIAPVTTTPRPPTNPTRAAPRAEHSCG